MMLSEQKKTEQNKMKKISISTRKFNQKQTKKKKESKDKNIPAFHHTIGFACRI